MVKCLEEARIFQKQFDQVSITQVLRSNNNHVDSLTTLATSVSNPTPRIITIESFSHPGIQHMDMVCVENIHPSLS